MHRVSVSDPHAHLVDVETTVSSDQPLPSPLVLFMASWTPGSYLVREYARHVEGLTCPTHPVRKTRKNAWTVAHDGAKELTVRYRVYANDLTVRTNHVDTTHWYLNGASTFLAVEGRLGAPAEVELLAPSGWRVATAMPPVEGAAEARPRFLAADYDTLVDSPMEVGSFREARFEAAGKPHRFAVWPPESLSEANLRRLVEATTTIVKTEASLFGGSLPHEGYTFILHLSPRGRGGLEHLASSSLLASATAMDTHDGTLDLLSLVAHEYFHLWNVKRIRPAGLHPYRYQDENHTRLLWWFEGATSYYDWRVLRLAGLCTETEYLDHLATEVAYLDQTPGRLVHPLEEASFDAWVKLYRPDENSTNSSVSYYRKGEMVCALLDLELRARSGGKASLDAVLAHLWNEFGRHQRPVPEDGMQEIFEHVAGTRMGDLFDAWVRGAHEIDYDATLARAGLSVERHAKGEPSGSLGVRTRGDGARVHVASVLRGGAAQRAGVDPGDELVAVAGRRVLDPAGVEAALSGKKEKDVVPVLVAREGRIRSLDVTLDPPRLDRVKLTRRKDATPDQLALLEGWLGK